jgi:NCS1 nucleoside transporter family
MVSEAEATNPPGPNNDLEKVTPHVTHINSLEKVWTRARKWSRSIGVEELGVERVPEDMREDQSPRDLFTMFFAANCNMATLATGFLGPTAFGLGWWDSFLTIVFFNLIGAAIPALTVRFGPKLGLRTMIVPRYCFGWWPAKVLAVFNLIDSLGWAVVNTLSGATVLHDAGQGKLPMSISILIIGLVAIILGLFGYRVIHIYSRYCWIVTLICLIITAGFGARHFINVPMGHGSTEASRILSFSTAIIGFEVAWATIAADYSVYMRETVSDITMFSWTYAGLLTSQISIELLGAAIGSLCMSPDPRFKVSYDSLGIGGLVGSVFEGIHPGVRGLGYLIEALLGLSAASVVTMNIYSLGLAVQMVSKRLLVVPRLVWSLIGSISYLVIAIVARNYLEAVLEDFLLICAYWTVPFCTVLLAEHFAWRSGYQYDLAAWNDKNMLPRGIAASVTWLTSTVLAILSMSQAWWIGPIAAGIGGSAAGTDISWILAAVMSVLLYVPLRLWERRLWRL